MLKCYPMTPQELTNKFHELGSSLFNFASKLTHRQEHGRSLVQHAPFQGKRQEAELRLQELCGMLEKLDEKYAVPFLMHYHGWDYQEIAQYMQLPERQIKNQIFQARKQLKSLIRNRYRS